MLIARRGGGISRKREKRDSSKGSFIFIYSRPRAAAAAGIRPSSNARKVIALVTLARYFHLWPREPRRA